MWLNIVIPNKLFGYDLTNLKKEYQKKYDMCENSMEIITMNQDFYIDILKLINSPYISNVQYKNIKETLQLYRNDLDEFAILYYIIKNRQLSYKTDL